ncbi:MAG: sigma-70 family RNA polymerase sigma factor [Eubacteriales bacterium]|nr:sigma-70 family RNA polymerase sigma factor [Eubacteriales bacterium]
MNGEKNDYGSFEEMYESQYPGIHHYVQRMIRHNEAAVDDLTQEVFFVAYEKWKALKTHPNIPGFLTLVARNKIKKWFQKQRRADLDSTDLMDMMIYEEGPADELDAYQIVDFYSSLEHMLSGQDLNILRHYYEYGYTSSEMAERLGITESCFKARIARMKEKIKSSMKMMLFLAVCIAICGLSGI